MGMPPGERKGGAHHPASPPVGTRRRRASEKGLGGRAMGSRPVAVIDGPHDLEFEQADAFVQFVVRIGVEHLGCQLAGQVTFGARALILIHCGQQCAHGRLAVNALHG